MNAARIAAAAAAAHIVTALVPPVNTRAALLPPVNTLLHAPFTPFTAGGDVNFTAIPLLAADAVRRCATGCRCAAR